MEIITSKNKIKNGINIIERIPTKSLNLLILNNVLIKAKKNFLTLNVTDLEIGIKYWILAKIEKEGSAVIPIKPFSFFISLLPEKNINIKLKDNSLIIESENNKTKLNTLNVNDFPLFPEINKENYITIDSDFFCDALSQIINFTSTSTLKPEITGIYFNIEKKILKIVSTDGYRLGERKIFLNNNINNIENYSTILSQKTVREIINIFSNLKKKELKIYFSENQILIESLIDGMDHPEINIISRLIDGVYPNYKEIIPKSYKTKVLFLKQDFLNKIKTANYFSGKNSEVQLEIIPNKNKIKIFSKDTEIGEYESFLLTEVEGDPIKISFNARFFLDGINSIKSQEIIFEIKDENSAGVLRSPSDDSYFYIVMPIRN